MNEIDLVRKRKAVDSGAALQGTGPGAISISNFAEKIEG